MICVTCSILIHIMHRMHLSGIDLNLALVLHALLAERSVSRAAKRIGLSQSATSHALARLRGLLDDPLVTRLPNGIAPTARARELAAPLARAMSLLEDALVHRPTFSPRTAKNRFQIAATDYVELLLLPALVADLEKRAPDLQVWLRPFAADALDAANRGDLDLVIGVFRGEVDAPLRSTVLFDERLVSVVRDRHVLANGRLTLDRFVAARHILVAPRGMPGGIVDDALAARGLSRSIAVAVPHFLAAVHLVARSELVLTVARGIARHFADVLPLRILKPPLPLPPSRVVMVWHARHDDDPAHVWLRSRIAAVARASKGR